MARVIRVLAVITGRPNYVNHVGTPQRIDSASCHGLVEVVGYLCLSVICKRDECPFLDPLYDVAIGSVRISSEKCRFGVSNADLNRLINSCEEVVVGFQRV